MAARARRCQGCGAPLPASTDQTSAVTCPFCGMVNDLASARAGQPVVQIDLRPHVSKVARASVVLFLVGTVVILVCIGGVVALVLWTTRSVATHLPASPAAIGEPTRLPSMKEFAEAKPQGWRQVLASPPPSGWGGFDPVDGLPWMMTLAREWAADATLTRIDLTRAAADGTVNLSGDAEDNVMYRFVSPQRIAEWSREADITATAEAAYGLMVRIAQQKVIASIQEGRPPRNAVPPGVQTLSLSEVLARARKQTTFADRPFYAGYLVHLTSEGWVWYFQTLSGRDQIPRVRARDGRVYPYR